MKRTLLVVTWIVCAALLAVAPAQAQSTDSLIVQGKRLLATGLNETDIAKMQQARVLFERTTQDPARAALAHYYVGLADNRLGNIILLSDAKQGMKHINQAIEHLQEATKIDQDFAEAHALLSSVYGRKIGAKPMLGMLLGPKADATLRKARDLDSENPRIVYIEAMSDFHKPETWGGSLDRALEGLQRAATLFADEIITDPLQPSWGHDETYAWLGIGYMRKEEYHKAQEAFDKALEINPDFGWVREVLLVQLASEQSAN